MNRSMTNHAALAIAGFVLALCLAPGWALAAENSAGTAGMQEGGEGAFVAAAVKTDDGAAMRAAASTKTSPKATKAENPMKAKAKASKITVRYLLVRKADQVIKKSKAFSVSKAQGKVTFKKKSGNSRIIVAKNGEITLKKGLSVGTYNVKVQVKAAGNANYKAASKVVTIKIRLRGDIKGNISYTTGEKIYHVPGDMYYESTVIDESKGERWFVSEQQARKAGWRHSKV